MRYMLDTDICIYAINERPAQVLQAFREHHDQGLGISAVTASELQYGVARTGSARNAEALQRLLAGLEVAAFDAPAAEAAGRLRAWLAAQGTPSGPYDSLIAAHAQALRVPRVARRCPSLRRRWLDRRAASPCTERLARVNR